MVTFRTIVVPTDFSETSREAVRIAREMAAGTPSRIHLLHVVPDIWHQPLTVDEPFVDFPALQRGAHELADLRFRSHCDVHTEATLQPITAIEPGQAMVLEQWVRSGCGRPPTPARG